MIFEKPIATDVSTADKITHTAYAIHNWLRNTSNNYLMRDNVYYENVDTEEIIIETWGHVNPTLLSSID